jgi:hypothetical protein
MRQQQLVIPILITLASTQMMGCVGSSGLAASDATCKGFLADLQAHRFTNAYSRMTSASHSYTSPKKFQETWATIEKKNGKALNWSQTGYRAITNTSGNFVALSYKVNFKQRPVQALFRCDQSDGKWLIQGMDFKW